MIPNLVAKAKEPDLPMVPKWKTKVNNNNVTKNSIMSRTRHVLNSIATAASEQSKLRRIEDLLLHIKQFPEARHHAVKDGAIKILLRTRSLTRDEPILGKLNSTYCMLSTSQ